MSSKTEKSDTVQAMKRISEPRKVSMESNSRWNLSPSVSSVSAAAAHSFRRRMQEAETLELQAVQMERRGMFLTNARNTEANSTTCNNSNNNNSELNKEIDNCEQQGIALMEQALQIRAQVRLEVQDKIETLTAQHRLQSKRKMSHASGAQELASITRELNSLEEHFYLLIEEQLKAVERLLVRCNIVATTRFKQNDFDVAVALLEFCLSATQSTTNADAATTTTTTNNNNNNNNDDDVNNSNFIKSTNENDVEADEEHHHYYHEGKSNSSINSGSNSNVITKKTDIRTHKYNNDNDANRALFPWEFNGEVLRKRLRGVTLNNYGCCERRRGHFSQALHYLQESVNCTQVESPVAFMNMSAILTQLMCPAEAVEMAERAIHILLQPSPSPSYPLPNVTSSEVSLNNNNNNNNNQSRQNEQENEDEGDDDENAEKPSLLAVAHHNLAMALEPIEPERAEEEYSIAYALSCDVLGKESETTFAIERSWNRFAERQRTTHNKKHKVTHHLLMGSKKVSASPRPQHVLASHLSNNAASQADLTLSDYVHHIFPHPFVYEASKFDGCNDEETSKELRSGRSTNIHVTPTRNRRVESNIRKRIKSHGPFAGSDVISPREAIAKLPLVPSPSPSLLPSAPERKSQRNKPTIELPAHKPRKLPDQTPSDATDNNNKNKRQEKHTSRERKASESKELSYSRVKDKNTTSNNSNNNSISNSNNNSVSNSNNNSVSNRNSNSKQNVLSDTLPPFTSTSSHTKQKEQSFVRPSAHTMPAHHTSSLSPHKTHLQQQHPIVEREQAHVRASNEVKSRTLSKMPHHETTKIEVEKKKSDSPSTRADRATEYPVVNKNVIKRKEDQFTLPAKRIPKLVQQYQEKEEEEEEEQQEEEESTSNRFSRSVENVTREQQRTKRTPQLTPRNAWQQNKNAHKQTITPDKEVKHRSMHNKENVTSADKVSNTRSTTLPSLKLRDKLVTNKEHHEEEEKEEEMKNRGKVDSETNEIGEWDREDAHLMPLDTFTHKQQHKSQRERDKSKVLKTNEYSSHLTNKQQASNNTITTTRSLTPSSAISKRKTKNVNTSGKVVTTATTTASETITGVVAKKGTITDHKSSKAGISAAHKNRIATMRATQLLHQTARGYTARRQLYTRHVQREMEKAEQLQHEEAHWMEEERRIAAVHKITQWWHHRRNVLHAHYELQQRAEGQTKWQEESTQSSEEEYRLKQLLYQQLHKRHVNVPTKTYTFAEMKQSAIKIQSLARGWLARQEYTHLQRVERDGHEAAIHIQRIWRGIRAREHYSKLKARHDAQVQEKLVREVQYAAALTIQRQWRRYVVEKKMKPILASWHEEQVLGSSRVSYMAARCIQCAWRRHHAYHELHKRQLAQHEAIYKREQYMKRRNAVIMIQSFARMWLAQDQWRDEIAAARQRAAHVIATHTPEYEAASVIQRAYKTYVAKVKLEGLKLTNKLALRESKRAALTFVIQCIGRGYVARRTLAHATQTILRERQERANKQHAYETERRLRAEWKAEQERITNELVQLCENEEVMRDQMMSDEKEEYQHLRGLKYIDKRAMEQDEPKKQRHVQHLHSTTAVLPTCYEEQIKEKERNYAHTHNNNNNKSNSSYESIQNTLIKEHKASEKQVLSGVVSSMPKREKPLIPKLELREDKPIQLGSHSSSSYSSTTLDDNSLTNAVTHSQIRQDKTNNEYHTVLVNFAKMVYAKKQRKDRLSRVETYLREAEAVDAQEEEQKRCALCILSYLRVVCARKLLARRKLAIKEYLEQCTDDNINSVDSSVYEKRIHDVTRTETYEINGAQTKPSVSISITTTTTTAEVEKENKEITKTAAFSLTPSANNNTIITTTIINDTNNIKTREQTTHTSLPKESVAVECSKQTEPRVCARLFRAICAGKQQEEEEQQQQQQQHQQQEEEVLRDMKSLMHRRHTGELSTEQKSAIKRIVAFCRGCHTRAYFHTLQAIRNDYVEALVDLQRNELPDLECGALHRYKSYFKTYNMSLTEEHANSIIRTQRGSVNVKPRMTTKQAEASEEDPKEERKPENHLEQEPENENKCEDDARNMITRFMEGVIAKRALVQRQKLLSDYIHESEKCDELNLQNEEAKCVIMNFAKVVRAKKEMETLKAQMRERCDCRINVENESSVNEEVPENVIVTPSVRNTDKDDDESIDDEKENTLTRERNELERLAEVENNVIELTNENETLNTLLDAEEMYEEELEQEQEQQEQHSSIDVAITDIATTTEEQPTHSLLQSSQERAAETIVKFIRMACAKITLNKCRSNLEEYFNKLEIDDANTVKELNAANIIFSFCKLLSAKNELRERITLRNRYLAQVEREMEEKEQNSYAANVIISFARMTLAKKKLQLLLSERNKHLEEEEYNDTEEMKRKAAVNVIASFTQMVCAKRQLRNRLHARDVELSKMLTCEEHNAKDNTSSYNYEQTLEQEHEEEKLELEEEQQEEELEKKTVAEVIPEVETKGESLICVDARLNDAANTIQRFMRRVQAKAKLLALRQQEHERIAQGVAVEELLHNSSTIIQKQYRGHLARRFVSALKAYTELYRLNEIHMEDRDNCLESEQEQLQDEYEGKQESQFVQSSYEYKQAQQAKKQQALEINKEEGQELLQGQKEKTYSSHLGGKEDKHDVNDSEYNYYYKEEEEEEEEQEEVKGGVEVESVASSYVDSDFADEDDNSSKSSKSTMQQSCNSKEEEEEKEINDESADHNNYKLSNNEDNNSINNTQLTSATETNESELKRVVHRTNTRKTSSPDAECSTAAPDNSEDRMLNSWSQHPDM